MADVLVVDDDGDMQRLLGVLLGMRGHEVRTVGDAEDALLAIADQRPDVLLLDLSLPRRDGGDLLGLLDRGIGRPAVVCLVSAQPEEMVRAVAREYGVGFLHKPFGPDDLDRVLAPAPV